MIRVKDKANIFIIKSDKQQNNYTKISKHTPQPYPISNQL